MILALACAAPHGVLCNRAASGGKRCSPLSQPVQGRFAGAISATTRQAVPAAPFKPLHSGSPVQGHRTRATGDRKGPVVEPEIPEEIASEFLSMVETNKQLKLFISLCIDAVGAASYIIPGVGELGDLGWAPIQFLLLQNLYGSGLFAALGFAEEAFPGLDFIPTATIGWMLENVESLSGIRKILLGKGKDKSK